MGADLNDSDSMLSLAEMIDRGHAVPRSPTETKLELYHRAAQLGNQIAAHAEEVEQQKQNSVEIGRQQQLQQQQMAAQMFGLILQNMQRR
jgi:hypothetical protein